MKNLFNTPYFQKTESFFHARTVGGVGNNRHSGINCLAQPYATYLKGKKCGGAATTGLPAFITTKLFFYTFQIFHLP